MRGTNTGHAVFAVTMTGVGIIGIFNRDLMPVWDPVPGTGIAHELLVYLAIVVALMSGIGLLVQPMAAWAARGLFATLSFWLLLFRLPKFFNQPLFGACWTFFPLAVMVAAAWVLYVRLATSWDAKYLRPVGGERGLGMAHRLYGLSLVFFGTAHFIDLKDTVSLVPNWLPVHTFWAYFTGGTYIAAGLAMLFGIFAPLAAALSAVQIGSFLVLVWIPIVAAGSKVAFQWSETFLNAALLAAAWVLADSYGHTARLARGHTA